MTEMQTSAQPSYDPEDSSPVTRADLAVIHARLDKGSERMTAQDVEIADVKADLGTNTTATLQVLEIVEMGKSAFRAFEKIGKAFKWLGQKLYWLARVAGVLAGAAVAIKALIAVLLHGQPPVK